MKIVLIGFMGSGKTTVAKELQKKFNWDVIEMDKKVLERTDSTDMNEVFTKGGEILLRETEITLAKDLQTLNDVIISTGGGVVMNKITIDYLKQNNGKIFFLNTPFELISTRLVTDTTRPLFQNKITARELYDFRLPLYLKYADYTISTTNKNSGEVSNEIYNFLRNKD